MRRVTLAGLAALGAWAAPAAAEAVTFDISGTCSVNCASSGLADGGVVEGNLVVDSATFAPGGFFSTGEIGFFIFKFGSSWIQSPGPNAEDPAGGWYGAGYWGDSPGEISSLLFNAAPGPSDPLGVGLSVLYNWQDEPSLIVTSLSSQCDDPACYTMSVFGPSATGAPTVAAQGEQGPAPIPAPPALALLLTGMAGLGVVGLWRGPRRALRRAGRAASAAGATAPWDGRAG
jgi:hypothetical protein